MAGEEVTQTSGTGASSRAKPSKLVNDTRRILIASGCGIAASFVVSFAFSFSWAVRDERPVLSLSTTAGILALAIVMFSLYQVLTWHAFARFDGVQLREVARRTNPHSDADRLRDLMLGNGPKSWSVVAAVIAMLAVLVVIIDRTLRSNLIMVGAALVCVALSWVMIAFAFALSYLRLHAESPQAFDFPHADEHAPPVWRDYLYLAFQVSATFSSSDVTLTSTRARGQVTAQTIIAFAFNSVIVALLVSAIAALS